MNIYKEKLIIRAGVDDFFDQGYMRYDPTVYVADNDSVTFNTVDKSDAITHFLNRDYRDYNSGRNSLQYYSLYAVCLLGVCDLVMIRMFIKQVARKNEVGKAFENPNSDAIRTALKRFVQNGLVMRHLFEPEGDTDNIALYMPTQSGLLVLKNGMQKEGMKEVFSPIMPPFKLLGKAVSTYVTLSMSSLYDDFLFRDGFFSTFIGGHLFLNNVIDTDPYGSGTLIGITDLFMAYDLNGNYLPSDADYFINSRVVLVEQFKFYAKGLDKHPVIIICVSKMSELEAFIKKVLGKKNADSVLMDIYFTTEMAFRRELPNRLLSVRADMNGAYEVIPVNCADI